MNRLPFRRTLSVAFFFLLGALSIAARANAQWTVIQLHPADATESWAYGGGGGPPAGWAPTGGTPRAPPWLGTAPPWGDPRPPRATHSSVYGGNDRRQEGRAAFC